MIRDKIWYEMTHIKLGDRYLAHFLDRQKDFRKWFKIFLLTFSSAGVFGWQFWDIIPLIACGLMGVMQIASLIKDEIMPTDKDIDSVATLRNKHITYFNKLEKLWIDYNANNLTDNQATEQFYELRQIGADIEAADNKIKIGDIKSLYKKADQETTDYFKQFHS